MPKNKGRFFNNNLVMRKDSIFITLSVFIFLFIFKANPVNAISCPNVPLNGTYTVATSCTFDFSVNGVENGSLIVGDGVNSITLTINCGQTIVFNPGYSVIIKDKASIAICKGTSSGQLKKTYLWMIDADGDNYTPATTTQYYGDTSPISGARRRYLIATTREADCCDSSSSTYPGQSQWFTSTNTCGSWDYDCNLAIEKNPDTCQGYATYVYYNTFTCYSGDPSACLGTYLDSVYELKYYSSELDCGTQNYYFALENCYACLGSGCKLPSRAICFSLPSQVCSCH